jgi:DNA modification methylase
VMRRSASKFMPARRPSRSSLRQISKPADRTNVLDYPGVNSLHPARRGDLELHPTTKPIALIADLIRDCSRRNGIILDPFGGSGTTILAAERTGRVARVIELDPLYVDVTIRRWERATGARVCHVKTGLSFADVESERRPHSSQVSTDRAAGRARGERP